MLTAAQMTILAGNLNVTAPALATTPGAIFAVNGANSIAERIPTSGFVSATEANASTAYVNLTTAGPDVNLDTGPKALLLLTSGMFNNTVNAEAYYGYSVSNATTIAAGDPDAVRHTSATASAALVGTWAYVVSLNAGANNFRARYRVSSGTGTWFDRRLTVVPF